MKRSLMDMRKIVAPERDMIATINTGVTDIPGMTDEATRYFRDLYDHLIRVADRSTTTGTCSRASWTRTCPRCRTASTW